MNKLHLLLSLATFLFFSCQKQASPPYSIFWFQGEAATSEALYPVNIGEYNETIIESGFQSGSPEYFLQLNDMTPHPIEDSSFIMESHGWDGEKSQYFETVHLGLSFDSTEYSKGDVLTVISRHSGFKEELQLVIL